MKTTRLYPALALLALGSALLAATVVNAEDELVWVGCGITKKAFMAELASAYEKKTGVKIAINGGGATKGIRDTGLGASHMGGACRVALEDHEEERKVNQIPLAWDALVIIVNPSNPVDNLSLSQLRKIYLGQITNWKEVGGNNAPIELYVREGKLSGVGRTLRELVFADYNQDFTPRAKVMASTGPLEKAVEENPYAIGTTGSSSALKRPLKVLKLDGREPTYESIKEGDYLLYRPLYLVVPKTGVDPRVQGFIRFAQSREGKEIIRTAGAVPYTDAIGLVMKQVEQLKRATEAGL